MISRTTLLAAVLAAAAQGNGLVVVHGGGDEVSTLQRTLGMEPTFIGGRRVTRAEDLGVVRMVLSGTTNKRLVAQLPAGAGWDDLAYEVYVRQAIEQGVADADAGRTVDHETALARVRARIRRPA